MAERNLKGDMYEALYILEKMHKNLENWEIFPDSLVEEAKHSIRTLAKWTVEDKEVSDYIDELKDLLMLQLRCNKELEKRKESLWEADRSRLLTSGVFAGNKV